MKNLKKRLLNLAIGEFTAICAFIFVFIQLQMGIASILGFSYLIIILLQGSLYWLYRYILLIKKESHSLNAIRILIVLRQLNMISALVISVLIHVVNSDIKDLLIAISLFLFGIIEYINYYWYRLSYGKTGFNIRILLGTKLRKSSINKLISK